MAAMSMAIDRAVFPQFVEYVMVVNSDDPMRLKYIELFKESDLQSRVQSYRLIDSHEYAGAAPAWSHGAKHADGDILIQGQDDIEPPERWDLLIYNKIKEFEYDIPMFIAVSDGFRKDALCCTAIMTSSYRALTGDFLCPEYISVFSDDEVTYRALRNARDGKSKFIDAKEIVFLHRHHYHDKNVPFDSTYERENSAKAYAHGQRLFWERNPRALTDGLKTW